MQALQMSFLSLLLFATLIFSLGGIVSYFVVRARVHAESLAFQHEKAGLSQDYERVASELQRVHQEKEGIRLELQELKVAKHQLDISVGMLEQQVHTVSVENTKKREKIDELAAKIQELTVNNTQVSTSLAEREHSHQQQLALFDEQKKALEKQFAELASTILESKTKALQENAKASLTTMLSPFEKTLSEFKLEIKEIHHRETIQATELKKELHDLKDLNQKMTNEAHQLSTALQGQKKLQGNWGELVLENVLDRSGLQLGHDYKREVSFTTEEGRQRPDVIVYLPQNKHLIIDAKVSLNAYTRYINASDDIDRNQALKQHVAAVSDRIQELAAKDYSKLADLNSPEIVFMFIPIESAFVEALKADETLFQRAIENNVLVATPTTLLTSLNIVRQLWRFEDQNKHTVALATKAEAVFKKLNTFLKSFEEVKKGLARAQDAYGLAEAQLLSGRGNLVKQVGDFKNLAPAIKQELPSYYADKANLEIDFVPPDYSSSVHERSEQEQKKADEALAEIKS